MKPLLVLTATRGQSAFLRETVESVRRMDVPASHYIVCPSAVVAEMRRLKGIDGVIAEDEGVRGLYAALNHGAARVGGDWQWLTYINDDDMLLPGFRQLWQRVKNDSTKDIVYGRVAKLSPEGRSFGWVSTLRNANLLLPLACCNISGFNQQGALINRGVWDRLGGFRTDYRIVGDFDFFVRAAASGARFGYVAAGVGGFRIHRGQISQDVGLEKLELAHMLERNQLRCSRLERILAVLVFRVQNIGSYCDRFRRGDFRSSRCVLAGN